MNTDSRSFLVLSTVLMVGVALGGAFTFNHFDQRIDSLNEKLESETNSNVVYLNHSDEDGSLERLFDDVDQSVVSVNAYGSQSAQGSGFIYSEEGHIVTNEHVVSGARAVEVTFTDGRTVNADIVGMDPYTDLAVLKVGRDNLDTLKLGNSSEVDVGQRVVAVGNPFGLSSSMTSGIISQKGRLLPVQDGFSIPNVLQTDAAINPGNSGGPLMNIEGEVVGVNTAIETRTGTFSGIGFAIPVETVKRVIPELIEDGGYRHSWIGVSGVDVNEEIAEEMDLENNTGFLVVDVVENGPAAEAGIKAGNRTAEINGFERAIGGDVIVAIDGEKMRGISDVLTYLARETEVGDKVEVTVIRDNRKMELSLTLDSRPGQQEN